MNIIQKVAKAHGVSVEEVQEEMFAAIRVGRENPDSNVQAMWNGLFPDGKEPTLEELIQTLAGVIQAREGNL